MGLDLSVGQIDTLLASGQESSRPKSSLLKAGLASSAVTVDDSGARHPGQDGYVTVVSGPTFAVRQRRQDRIGFRPICMTASRPMC